MNRPTLNAYVVTDPKEGSGKKAVWHRVGAVWPHKSGKGFDLVIPEGISISGRIVCIEPKQEEAPPV
jgi:type IV secretory pathway TraG/TraD family ATPase VirD4